jgi:hypothetical protein
MSIFRPEIKESTGNKYTGVCKFAILNFEDKSGLFDWADLYLEVEVKQEGSEYSRNLQIKGSFEKDSNGKITGGSVLKRLYGFFDAIGCKAGLNIDGEWEDENGAKIEAICDYLSMYTANPIPGSDIDSYPYIAYFYKEQPKKIGGKSYTNVWPKVYTYSEENITKLKNDIDWLKGKGYLKELSDEVANAPAFNESSLSNL